MGGLRCEWCSVGSAVHYGHEPRLFGEVGCESGALQR